MLFQKTLLASLCLTLAGVAGSASAADTTQTMKATSSVVASCSVSTQDDMTFYPYDAAGYNATRATSSDNPVTINLRCTRGSQGVVLSFDEGQNKGSGSTCQAPIRNMLSADGKQLRYKLSTRPAPLFTFDSNTPDAVCRWGSVWFHDYMETSVFMYGFLPAGQNVSVGSYSDTITFTLTF